MNKIISTDFNLDTIRAIVGLGNPGSQYTRTRHNAGFLCIDELASAWGASWNTTPTYHASTIERLLSSGGRHKIYLFKPQTFMNDSGVVASKLRSLGIKPHEVLVIHDELEKAPGTLQLRLGGSARGHNGLRSLIERMGSEFWRLRLGIGRPDHKDEVANYVLTSFSPPHEELLYQAIYKVVKDFTG